MLSCLWVQEAGPWPVGLGFLPHWLGSAPVEGDLYLIVYRLSQKTLWLASSLVGDGVHSVIGLSI